MSSATPQLDFIAQIRLARDDLHKKFNRLTTNVNTLEIRLLQELQKLEFEYREYEGAAKDTRENFQSLNLALDTQQNVSKTLVLDWNDDVEQTLLNRFCTITVNTKVSTTIDPAIEVPNPEADPPCWLDLVNTRKVSPDFPNFFSSASDECAHHSMRLVDRYRVIADPEYCSSTRGNKFGQLSSARGVSIDAINNEIYIADTNNNRIQVFNWAARCIDQFTHHKMLEPKGICFSEFENIYITLSNRDIVQSYLKDGTFVKEIGYYYSTSFDNPLGITVDDISRVYVCDHRNDSVVVFGKDLHYITVLTKQVSRPRDVKVRGSEVVILSGDTSTIHCYSRGGKSLRIVILNEQVGNAYFFDTDSRGNFLVTDVENNCVKIFNPKGYHICNIGEKGEGRGKFEYPTGIAVDTDDDSFVTISDRNYTQLQIFFP